MNIDKLKEAEAFFMQKYPGGFAHPDMLEIGKKHKMDKMISFCQESFAPECFSQATAITEAMVKTVSRSSMVSMFEKPKFKDFVATFDSNEHTQLAEALHELLHGDQHKGFEQFVAILQRAKLAKWSLVTIIPNYVYPEKEVFVKPTTAKGVIKQFELEGLDYKPAPTWAFYEAYRKQILEMKALVDGNLSPNNAAFCGFLMMTM